MCIVLVLYVTPSAVHSATCHGVAHRPATARAVPVPGAKPGPGSAFWVLPVPS